MPIPSTPASGRAAARAYDYVKRAILSAVLPGGSVLTEAGLAHEIGTSRTPVREALLGGAAGNAVLSSVYRTLRERQTLSASVIMRGRADRMQAAVDEHLQCSISLARESR